VISACILAGGRATRLGGRAKPLVAIDGATILERQLAVLAPRVDEVLIAVAPGAPPLPVPAGARVRCVEDAAAGAGPLAGIAACLAACRAPWLLVVAGDLPRLDGRLVDLLISSCGPDVDAVAPRVRGLPEPLLACYAASAAPAAQARLAGGRRKTSGLLTDEGLRVRWLDEPALRAADPELASFSDIDTPEDLAGFRS
jgi:molybdopterin-guanine dinucleotide biosynthesis protein A